MSSIDSSSHSAPDWKGELRRVLKSKGFRYAAVALAGILVLRIGIIALSHRSARKVTPVVDVIHAGPRTIDNSLSLPGNFEAIEQASLFAHVSGYLKKIYVDEGDTVKKGQLMAQIEAPDIIQEYNRAKADDDLQDVTFKRNEELLKENVISQQEFDTINATAQKSRARLENAIANVNYTQIRAPFTGAVARRFKYPGDLIEVGGKSGETPLFIVVNEETLRIAVNVPQIDVTRIKIGDTVDISVDALGAAPLHGQVSRLDDLLDNSTKTQRVLIDIPNPGGKLHAGMFATVMLHLDHKDGALAIPRDAVTTDPVTQKNWVWLVSGGKLKRQEVTLGIRDLNWTEISSGIGPSDAVVVSTSEAFTDGQPVKLREVK